ncbi:uncharacterized protein yc1106_07931 [Curvularia clavata]|uniref:Ankyrin repeat protein n=1 Tax=Curvularia clavata TaxID=95742 RepID=A0A9Q8ZER5_CURCL|nr:uncharacterized protein yc1106_07931 [Curvularia clavata]
MTEQQQISTPMELPPLPAKHVDWIAHVASHPDGPLSDLMAPYKEYDATLRQIFAQQPDHPAIDIPNIVPVYAGREHELTIRARNPAKEPEAERQHYIMPLSKDERKPSASPAVVTSLKEFEKNFQLFSESSLADLDWSNVVAAGSAVVTSLLPVSEEHKASKRALREYYHQHLAPASDVDLFLYGLTEEEAVEKIKQIEKRIKDSILTETTTIRTKNAITIASQYPTRHVQIVLRIYRSISEILTGFDVDCSCVAYDGKQVYASPRALAAFMTQINTIDLTRRSPSYENRLSKYARRGFEVYWPLLDRSRIDPTLFERSFGKTLGLARLLVLERLPENHERQDYIDQRRAERGRPMLNRRFVGKQWGNMKDEHEEDVAEWVETDEVSNYHTFTIPYGPKYHARKIEKLLYAKDLLLNAEWNRPKDRETNLHRHPAFFGNATDVIEDCCGYCPKPATPEDKEIAAEESKVYVSGPLSFIKDDPGRQAIGSFHPLTDDDWTEMAYVGNTARLCRAIVDKDLEHVQDWLSQEGADPNRRDYTGRTPLHLAVTTSTPEIVQALIDAGARLVSRLYDGKTALHLAAMRGETEMARALLIKSEANEEKEAEKEAQKKKQRDPMEHSGDVDSENSEESEDLDDIDRSDFESEDENEDARTEGSFIKITHQETQSHEVLPEESDDEPDIYDINVLAWDTPVTALHLAIANGHVPMVKLLIQDFGADVLLPVKLVNDGSTSPRASILPLVLALHLPPAKAKEMTQVLIGSGASPAQGDVHSTTALSYFAAHGADLLRTMISSNQSGSERAANHISISPNSYSGDGKSALHMAIQNGDLEVVDALLELGVKPEVDFDTYIASAKHHRNMSGDTEHNQWVFKQQFEQPVFSGVFSDMPSAVRRLVDAGADINSLSKDTWQVIRYPGSGRKDIGTLLDVVRNKIRDLQTFTTIGKVEGAGGCMGSTGWIETAYNYKCSPPIPLQDDNHYLRDLEPGTYAHFMVSTQLKKAKETYQSELKSYERWLESQKEPKGTSEKKAAAESLLKEFEALECYLVERGAKTLKEVRSDVNNGQGPGNHPYPFHEEPPKPWKPNLTFALPDLTNERKEAYVKLFEACWEGNLSTIKELTLSIWGNKQTPLKISALNSDGLSPLSIAVLRKHYSIARAILEIAHAQHAPEDTSMVRHAIQQADEDDNSTCDGQDEIQIYREIVDERFTIENIGEVQAQVQSTTTPLQMIQSDCPTLEFMTNYDTSLELSGSEHKEQNKVIKPRNLVQFAIYSNDSNLFEFLVERCEEYAHPTPWTSNEASPKVFDFPEADFLYALRLGRVQLLEKIIQRTGAGFPLNDLVEQSGIEIPMKPAYYQGLSVHGKKRADWANAARGAGHRVPDMRHPPLLWAAYSGSLQSVEWFLGDAPLRCYLQFADTHRDDVRIQNLAKAKGGVEASITKWLDLHSHLLLHCVVMGAKSEESLLMLRNLCRNYPEALEKRSTSGMTPLHIAFALHRVEMVKILLEVGADQTTRNNDGNNIIHSMLDGYNTTESTPGILRELLGLIDARLLPSLFFERTQNAATPLACWIHGNVKEWERRPDKKYGETVVQLLLEFSKGEDLGIINGDGDTPIHAVVRYGADTLLRTMLSYRPEILFYENASGRTPFEIAEDSYLSKEIFSNPPSLSTDGRYRDRMRHGISVYMYYQIKGMLGRDPSSFVQEAGDGRSSTEKVLQVCKDFAEGQSKGHKRRLVSLVEANEVAKRLAARNTGYKPWAEEEEGEEEDEEQKDGENDSRDDEVKVWFNWGLR